MHSGLSQKRTQERTPQMEGIVVDLRGEILTVPSRACRLLASCAPALTSIPAPAPAQRLLRLPLWTKLVTFWLYLCLLPCVLVFFLIAGWPLHLLPLGRSEHLSHLLGWCTTVSALLLLKQSVAVHTHPNFRWPPFMILLTHFSPSHGHLLRDTVVPTHLFLGLTPVF